MGNLMIPTLLFLNLALAFGGHHKIASDLDEVDKDKTVDVIVQYGCATSK